MKKFPSGILLLIFLVVLSGKFAYSQVAEDSSAIWRIETSDGNEFFGPVLSKDKDTLRVSTKILGILNIPVIFIKSVTPVDQNEMKSGEIWLKNPQAARYFYAPNGYGLDKGVGYYQNTWVLFNQVSYGITKNISFGAGLIPLFLFAGTATPVWITPKFSIPAIKEKLNIGGGVLLAGIIGEQSQLLGIAYGVSTLGNHDNNVSVGLGFAFYDKNWVERPVINFGGMVRIGKKGYILTENYVIPVDDAYNVLISLGGRTVWSKLSLDYGLILPLFLEDNLIAIPWLGFTLPLGKSKK